MGYHAMSADVIIFFDFDFMLWVINLDLVSADPKHDLTQSISRTRTQKETPQGAG